MFYIAGGDLYLTDAARLIPEVRAWEEKYVGKPAMRKDMGYYIRYVIIPKNNDYYGLPPVERKRTVVQSMGLFGVDKKIKMSELDKVIDNVCRESVFAALLAFCDKLFLTDKQRFDEQLRMKEEKMREEYINCTDDKQMNEKYRSLLQIQTMRAKIASEMASEDDNVAIEYLFELPDNIMPYHLKL